MACVRNNTGFKSLTTSFGKVFSNNGIPLDASDYAQNVMSRNNGFHISLNSEGNPSELYKKIQKKYDDDTALFIKSVIHTDSFMEKYDSRVLGEPEIDSKITYFNGVDGKIYIDENDAIINNVNVNDKVFINTNNELASKKNRRLNQKNAEIFKSVITKVFPDINIDLITREEVISTVGFNNDGYVDSNGTIKINIDSFEAKKGLHELGHIIKEVLKQSNLAFHDSIIDQIKSNLGNNSDISKVANLIKAKYDLEYSRTNDSKFALSNNELIDEVFAELIGLGNEETMNKLFSDANQVVDESLYGKFKKLIKGILNTFKNLISGGKFSIHGNTIEDLNRGLEKMLTSDQSYFFNDDEYQHLKKYFKDTGNHYRMAYDSAKSSIKPISNSTNLREQLIGESFMPKSSLEDAKTLLFEMERRTTNESEQYTTMDQSGTVFGFDKNLPKEKLLSEIESQIIVPRNKLREELKSNIADRLNNKKKDVDVSVALRGLVGKKTSALSISNIVKFMNLDSKLDSIMSYNELKDSNNETLRNLYNSDLSDTNPLIIIHNITEDGIVDMSIVDISTNFSKIGPKNIFNNFISDSEYMTQRNSMGLRNKEKLSNSDLDSRNFMIGLMILDMQNKTGNKVQFRNLATMTVSPKNTSAKMIHDPSMLIKNIALLSRITEVMNAIDNDRLKSLINSADGFKNEIKRSFVAQLKSYLTEVKARNITDPFILPGSGNFIDSFIDSEHDVKTQLEMIENLKAFIKSHSERQDPENSKLYYLLAGASRSLRNNDDQNYNDIIDISSYGKKFTTLHNMKSDYVQDVVIAVQETLIVINTKTANTNKKIAGTTLRPGIARKVLKESLKRQPDVFSESFFINRGSKIFEHMYKTAEIYETDINGVKLSDKPVKIRLPELHHTLEDKETKKLYDENKITDNDLELANIFLDEYKRLWVELMVHSENRKLRSVNAFSKIEEFTKEQAEAEYDRNFKRGEIVTISKSTSEVLTQNRVKDAINKAVNQVELSESLFDDMIDHKNTNIDELSNLFSNQRNSSSRYERIGLDIINGEFVIRDLKKAMDMSTDAWKTFIYFNQSTVRKIEHENRVLPVADNANTLLKQLASLGSSQNNNLEAIAEILNKNLNRKNEDDDKAFQLLKGSVKTSTLGRILIRTYSTAVLPLKLSIGFASFVFNTQRVVIESLAASLSKAEVGVPKLKTFGQAASYMLFNRQNFLKVRALGLQQNIFNRTERDLLNQPWSDLSNFKFYQEAFLNIFNWGTDTFQRLMTMTAVAMEDGSLEAYTYNKVSGEVEYDEKKDKQYYNESGEFKSKEAEAEYNRVKAALIDTGVMHPEATKLPTGYDANWTAHINFIINKYIIGSFTEDSKVLVTNKFWGAMATNFRLFSFDRLFNAGFLGETRNTRAGQRYKHIIGEDGEVLSKRDNLEMETIFNSLQRSALEIVEFKAYTPTKFAEWYERQNDSRKYNLVKTLIQLGMFAMIYAAYSIGEDDEDKKNAKSSKRSRTHKFLADIMIIGTFADMVNNPFPAIAALTRFYNGDYTAFIPAVGAVKEVNKYVIEPINSNNN